MTPERFAQIKRTIESTLHGPMIDELVEEIERSWQEIAELKARRFEVVFPQDRYCED